jgi:hypothetical protein
MIAQRLIEDARAAGLSMEVDGSDLIVEADRDPPADLLAELRQHKAEVIAFLRPPSRETADAAQDADDLDERAALIEYGAGVLRAWAEGYAALCAMPAPAGFSPERWQRIIGAAGTFIDRWAAEAIRCGWSDLAVFGCNPDRPDARFDAMGLVLLLDRCEVEGLDEDGADLVTATGARQRYWRRPVPADTVRLWDLVIARQGRDAG